MLTGDAFVKHTFFRKGNMYDEIRSSNGDRTRKKNDDKVKGKQGNNPVLCVASKLCSGIQLSCEVNSQKEMEKVDSIPSQERKDLNADMENPTKDSSPWIAANIGYKGQQTWKILQRVQPTG